jgi:hypothetical protein
LTLLLSKFRFLILWLGVALIVLAVPFAAQARDNWRSVRTKNFLLIGNGSEKEIREVATKLEQFRDVFNRLFTGSKINTPVPTTTYVQVDRTLTCGARKSPENVVVTFRPTSDAKDVRAKIDGEVLTVDLVPKEFTLRN